MISADWIAIVVLIAVALLGALLGFGKGLKFFTGGIFGIVISVVICYCFGGIILKLNFVQQMLTKFSTLWTEKDGFFFNLLTKIHPEIVVYYIVLFIVAQIVRIILVRALKHVAESKVLVIKIINKTLGAVLFVGMTILLGLLVFQLIYWVQGDTGALAESLKGSNFIGALYRNNPLLGLVEQVKAMAA